MSSDSFTDYDVTRELLYFEDADSGQSDNALIGSMASLSPYHERHYAICRSHGVPKSWIYTICRKFHFTIIDDRILSQAALRLYNTYHPLSVPQDLIFREVRGEHIVSWWWGASKALGVVAGPFSLAAFGLQRLFEDKQTHVMVFSKKGTYLRNYE